ncbi:MAG: hydantoin racemase [Alphaproteobacteria bacterium]|nr:hydantoin racemase [Alphaproteobacteria bacterium]
MRLLVLNANTSDFVTQRVADAVRRIATPGTEIVPVTGRFGARVIGSYTEMAIGEHSAIELMARHARGCDAVLIAVSWDSGLRAGRELLSIPVVGMTEAALLTARQLGARVGFVTFDQRSLTLYRAMIESYGFGPAVAGWRVVESKAVYTPSGATEVDRQICAAIDDLAERDGAEVAIVNGAVMAGAAARLAPNCIIPVLDGVTAGVLQAQALVRLGAAKPRRGGFARPTGREAIDVAPELIAALRGDDGRST